MKFTQNKEVVEKGASLSDANDSINPSQSVKSTNYCDSLFRNLPEISVLEK